MADGGTHGYQKHTDTPTRKFLYTGRRGRIVRWQWPTFYYFLTLTHFYGFLWGHLIRIAQFLRDLLQWHIIPERRKWRDPWRREFDRLSDVKGIETNNHPFLPKSRLFKHFLVYSRCLFNSFLICRSRNEFRYPCIRKSVEIFRTCVVF